MTDTTSGPSTSALSIGTDPESMFTTGTQASLTPNNTEPHPAPIFDTGPHPNPLQAFESEPVVPKSVVSEPVVSESVVPEPGSADEDAPEPSLPQAFSEVEREDTDAFLRSVNPDPVPVLADWPSAHPVPVLAQRPSAQTASVPAQPVVVPGTFEFVKRWRFALILVGVWAVSAMAGLGFYYWWYSALEKTVPVLGILGYLVICMVASLLVSLVPHRPQVTALAIALMAAPLASTAAAAVLHGASYFEWIARPVIGPVIG